MQNNTKELFLNPILNPISKSPTKHKNLDEFLRAQGIEISQSPDEHSMTSIRFGKTITIYGFKKVDDLVKTAIFLTQHNIPFECDDRSKGARYEYHIAIKK